MDELKGYIGLSSSVSVAPSGLYVDALPDISVSFLEKLIKDESSVSELWAEIEHRALVKFRTLFIREVNRCHRLSDVAVSETLIVENKELLATSLWYLLASEVMYERATSSRMNTYTTIDRSKAKEMREHFLAEFENELKVAVNGIDIHSSADVEQRDIVTFHTPIL
jgi:hypothetical protein